MDGGAQTAMSGAATHEGNGQWSWSVIPAAAMNGDMIGLLFVHADGRASFTIKTATTPYGALIAGTLAWGFGLKLAMVLPAMAMSVLIVTVLVRSRIWTMRTVERPT